MVIYIYFFFVCLRLKKFEQDEPLTVGTLRKSLDGAILPTLAVDFVWNFVMFLLGV